MLSGHAAGFCSSIRFLKKFKVLKHSTEILTPMDTSMRKKRRKIFLCSRTRVSSTSKISATRVGVHPKEAFIKILGLHMRSITGELFLTLSLYVRVWTTTATPPTIRASSSRHEVRLVFKRFFKQKSCLTWSFLLNLPRGVQWFLLIRSIRHQRWTRWIIFAGKNRQKLTSASDLDLQARNVCLHSITSTFLATMLIAFVFHF